VKWETSETRESKAKGIALRGRHGRGYGRRGARTFCQLKARQLTAQTSGQCASRCLPAPTTSLSRPGGVGVHRQTSATQHVVFAMVLYDAMVDKNTVSKSWVRREGQVANRSDALKSRSPLVADTRLIYSLLSLFILL
jgi:hypothetical protein